MLAIDWILLALWIFGIVNGWRLGMVKQVVSLTAFFAGLILAKMFYTVLGGYLSPHLDDQTTLANILAFIIIWIAVPIALSLCGELITTVLDKLFVLGKINKTLGAIVGFLKYGIILGALVWFFSTIGVLNKKIMDESVLCAPLKTVPEAIYTAIIDYHGGGKK